MWGMKKVLLSPLSSFVQIFLISFHLLPLDFVFLPPSLSLYPRFKNHAFSPRLPSAFTFNADGDDDEMILMMIARRREE